MSSDVIPCIYAEADLLADPSLLALAPGPQGQAESKDDVFVEKPILPAKWKLTPEDEALLDSDDDDHASDDWGADRDLWMYRDRTVALLKRFMRLSVEVGRLPSLLGREFFRSKVTSYHVTSFEDVVIFVHDMERSLEKLGWFEKRVIAMVVLEDFSQEEAARLLHCSPRTVGRYIYEALDRLSEIFLLGSILKPTEGKFSNRETACQGGKSDPIVASDCNEGKNKF